MVTHMELSRGLAVGVVLILLLPCCASSLLRIYPVLKPDALAASLNDPFATESGTASLDTVQYDRKIQENRHGRQSKRIRKIGITGDSPLGFLRTFSVVHDPHRDKERDVCTRPVYVCRSTKDKLSNQAAKTSIPVPKPRIRWLLRDNSKAHDCETHADCRNILRAIHLENLKKLSQIPNPIGRRSSSSLEMLYKYGVLRGLRKP